MKNHSPAELEARLRLHGLPELGPMRFLRLIEAFGSASSALAAPAGAWRTLGVPAEAAAARRSPAVREAAGEALRWLEGPRRHLLMWDDPGYPALLAEGPAPPPPLDVLGGPATLGRARLGVVG
ncbi:DNA processing protein DprA, partial [Pseudomonas aeruginosa]